MRASTSAIPTLRAGTPEKSLGGEHTWTNVVAACGPCNTRKGSHLLKELGWTLKQRPVAPRGTVVLLSSAGVHTVPDVWADWLPALA